MTMPKAFELKVSVRRRDFFCTECLRVTSVYVRRNEKAPHKIYCAWCSDNIFVEKYDTHKHGCISGHYNHWARKEVALLKELLQEPLSWKQIAEKLGRPLSPVRIQAKRMGLTKKYHMAKGRPPKQKL